MFKEVHFKDIKDVGIAYDTDTNRLWICFDGQSVFRAKLHIGRSHTIAFEDNLPEACCTNYTVKGDNDEKEKA